MGLDGITAGQIRAAGQTLIEEVEKTDDKLASKISEIITTRFTPQENLESEKILLLKNLYRLIAADDVAHKEAWNVFCNSLGIKLVNGGTQEHFMTLPFLCKQSPFFSYILSQTFFEEEEQEAVFLGGTEDPEIKEDFIRCLETQTGGEILNQENVRKLFFMAQKYEIAWLFQECQEFILNLLDPTTVDESVEWVAMLPFQLPELMDRCLIWILQNSKNITEEQFEKLNKTAQDHNISVLRMICNATLRPHFLHQEDVLSLTFKNESELREHKELLKEMCSQTNQWPSSLMLKIYEGTATISFIKEILENNCVVRNLELWTQPGDTSFETGFKIAHLEHLKSLNPTISNLSLVGHMVEDCSPVLVAILNQNNVKILQLNFITHFNTIAFANFNDVLQANTSLQTLIIQNIKLGNIEFSEGIKNNHSLKELRLLSAEIDKTGIKNIADIIKTNGSLEILDISENETIHEHAESLCEGLKQNSTIKVLNLSSCKLKDAEMIALADALENNATLQELDLSHNKISAKGIGYLCEKLKSNSSLKILRLSRNKIGDQGAKAIADLLQSNSVLQTLELEKTQISSEGVKHLAENLTKSSSLKYLDLSRNDIENFGAESLAKALETGSRLENLVLHHAQISDHGISLLVDACLASGSLKNLNLLYNIVDFYLRVKIAEKIKEYMCIHPGRRKEIRTGY